MNTQKMVEMEPLMLVFSINHSSVAVLIGKLRIECLYISFLFYKKYFFKVFVSSVI